MKIKPMPEPSPDLYPERPMTASEEIAAIEHGHWREAYAHDPVKPLSLWSRIKVRWREHWRANDG